MNCKKYVKRQELTCLYFVLCAQNAENSRETGERVVELNKYNILEKGLTKSKDRDIITKLHGSKERHTVS